MVLPELIGLKLTRARCLSIKGLVSMVRIQCVSSLYALAARRRPNRSSLSQKNTFPFSVSNHRVGDIPCRHFRKALSLIGF